MLNEKSFNMILGGIIVLLLGYIVYRKCREHYDYNYCDDLAGEVCGGCDDIKSACSALVTKCGKDAAQSAAIELVEKYGQDKATIISELTKVNCGDIAQNDIGLQL